MLKLDTKISVSLPHFVEGWTSTFELFVSFKETCAKAIKYFRAKTNRTHYLLSLNILFIIMTF
jgi:hypothetical protein